MPTLAELLGSLPGSGTGGLQGILERARREEKARRQAMGMIRGERESNPREPVVPPHYIGVRG